MDLNEMDSLSEFDYIILHHDDSDIQTGYLLWLMSYIFKEADLPTDHCTRIILKLQDTVYQPYLPMDLNRESDGMDLRYRYALESGQDPRLVADILDTRPCSMLEMMVALAIRCEDSIMSNPEYGDRTSKWFWDMVSSLGLASEKESEWDYILDRFMNNSYKRDGMGGLFYIPGINRNLTKLEIWVQLNLYLGQYDN